MKSCTCNADYLNCSGEIVLQEVATFIFGLITGGIGGSLLTFKFAKSQQASRAGTAVDQSRAKAGADIVGRDKKTKIND